MKKFLVMKGLIIMTAFFLLFPACIQAADMKPGTPPIEQPLVREGALALNLAAALKIGSPEDEVAAENMLADAGIAPINGWIMDYPVTPDIEGELRNSVALAAESRKIDMTRDDALKVFDNMMSDNSLVTRPYTGGEKYVPSGETQPDSGTLDYYYDKTGPPVVTYYQPPQDYYYLYTWVPYPFWWGDFWFGGFFILRDFHRVVIIHRRPVFITNHFNHHETHRVFRVDPVNRFRGKTFAGIGAHRSGDFISTGIPRSERDIFNTRSRGDESRGGAFEGPRGGREMMRRPSGGGINAPGGEMRSPGRDGRR